MIKSFKHKGLEAFFKTGSLKGIQAQHRDKLEIILAILNRAKYIEDLNINMFNLHPLKGDLKGLWSIKVNGNWRITFKFEDENVYVVDYQDYH
ncbi:MAG: type II toxin-antitoxin system RelE/ParE family toxin [Heliobacteriaceae bacterium]|jgi:proteic killer suppression protein|nr:type II toxin-antitoxin system RelE/ParE family toxin [Heliobacteriaceae bacterium]